MKWHHAGSTHFNHCNRSRRLGGLLPSSAMRVRSTLQLLRRWSFRWAPYHHLMPKYTAACKQSKAWCYCYQVCSQVFRASIALTVQRRGISLGCSQHRLHYAQDTRTPLQLVAAMLLQAGRCRPAPPSPGQAHLHPPALCPITHSPAWPGTGSSST